MRQVLLVAVLVLVALPAWLIWRRKAVERRIRAPWAFGAAIAPLAVIAVVNMVPFFTNDDPNAGQLGRMLGLALSAGGFILPWFVQREFLRRHVGLNRGRFLW